MKRGYDPADDPDPLDRGRFPVDPWRLVETAYDPADLGVTETLFSVGNGYLGMRANPEEGRDAHTHGTFVNGFHETWDIHHAESAFGFARTGQTIVNVPDAKVVKIYVDDEPLILGTADLEHYERSLDFRDGVLRRSLVWRTPAGKRVRVESTRCVSMVERHLALITLEVEMLDGDAPVVISSQILNRQDGEDEYHVPAAAMGEGVDPRKASRFTGRVLLPQAHTVDGGDDRARMLLGFRTARSGMTIAVAADHVLRTDDAVECVRSAEPDQAKAVYRVAATRGRPVVLHKFVSVHTSRGVPVRELSDRCDRTLDRARRHGVEHYHRAQREWYDAWWEDADVTLRTTGADPGAGSVHAGEERGHLQQAVRFNLLALAQASARADQQGVPAKGVTGSGYEGHYFWDTEVYVAPFLTYTRPRSRATCSTSAAGCCPPRVPAPARWRRAARSSPGAPSTARRPRPTTRPAPRRSTSTPTSPTPSRSTSTPPATPASSCATGSTCSSRPRGCGPSWASGAPTVSPPSTSTA